MDNDPTEHKKPNDLADEHQETQLADRLGVVREGLASAAHPAELAPDQSTEPTDAQYAVLARIHDMYPGVLDYVESLRDVSNLHLQRHPEIESRDGSVEKIKKIIRLIDNAIENQHFDMSGLEALNVALGNFSDGRRGVNDAKQLMYDEGSFRTVAQRTKTNRAELTDQAEQLGDDTLLPAWARVSDKFLSDATYLFEELADQMKSLDSEDEQTNLSYKSLFNSFMHLGISFDEDQFVTLHKKAKDLLASLEYANRKRDKIHESGAGLRKLCDTTLDKLLENRKRT